MFKPRVYKVLSRELTLVSVPPPLLWNWNCATFSRCSIFFSNFIFTTELVQCINMKYSELKSTLRLFVCKEYIQSFAFSGWRKVGTTDCAPHNGYYFLPIQPSDLASGGGTTNFRLTARPPTGWKIHPEEGVVIPVDGFSGTKLHILPSTSSSILFPNPTVVISNFENMTHSNRKMDLSLFV